MTTPRKLRHTLKFALALTACIAAFEVSAAITCKVSVTAISTVYYPTVATANDSTGSYTVSCTRLGTDPNTVTYPLGADNGLHAASAQNRVQFGGGANRYNYELYRDPAFTQVWGNTSASRRSVTVSFGAALNASQSGPFYMRVPGSQPVDPAGTYTDTVTVSLFAPGLNPTAKLNISAITTNSCQIFIATGNVNPAYTSLQASTCAVAIGSGSQTRTLTVGY